MKNTKLNWEWLVFFASVVVLILTLLTTCTGKQVEPAATVPTQTETTAAAETTVPETTAELTEETTEATEETVEETTEATTAPTNPPATGGNGSDDDDDKDKDKEEAKLEVPDPGTEKNPYVEALPEDPQTVTSVAVPAGKRISYLIFGSEESILTIADPNASITLEGTVYKADQTGVLTLDLSKVVTAPVIAIGNTGGEQGSFLLSFSAGVGTLTNPEQIETIELIQTELPAGDANGYHYQWTASTTGTVTLTTESADADVTVTLGERILKLADSQDGALVFDVAAGDCVTIHVAARAAEDGTYPALKAELTGTIAPALGAKENPQTLETADTFAVTLAEGDLDGYWYHWTSDITGTLELSTDCTGLDIIAAIGENSVRLSESENGVLKLDVSREDAVLIQTIAIADTEGNLPAVSGAVVTMLRNPNPGTPENPEVLTDLAVIHAQLPEGLADGYSWQWTAQQDGTLRICPEADLTECTAYELVMTNLSDGSTADNHTQRDAALTLELQKNDTVTIFLRMVSDEEGEIPSGAVTLKGSFTEAPGTSPENPLVLSDTGAATVLSLDAGETCYISAQVHEMNGAISNAHGVTLTFADTTFYADSYGILNVSFPEAGEDDEPVLFAVTSVLEKEVSVTFAYPVGHEKNPAKLVLGENRAALAYDDADGYLYAWTADCDGLLTISLDGYFGWQYTVENVTQGTAPAGQTSMNEGGEPGETVEVKAGDRIRIRVNTLGDDAAAPTPAGEIVLKASFFDPLLGTEAKPVLLDMEDGGYFSVSIPAGTARYYRVCAEQMLMTLHGQNVAVILNDTEFLPENGSLTVEATDTEMVFAIRNDSDAEQVCTLSFAYPVGHEKNPDQLKLGSNCAVLEADMTGGYTFLWQAEEAGELVISFDPSAHWQYIIRNESVGQWTQPCTSASGPDAAMHKVTVAPGDVIRIRVNTFDPEDNTVTPAGEVSFTAEFVYPPGHPENPLELKPERNTVKLEPETEGCFFVWEAESDGLLTITMEEDTHWQYAIHNLTTEVQGTLQVSDQENPALSCTVEVRKGDKILIMVNTYDPDAPEIAPGGRITFTVRFLSSDET